MFNTEELIKLVKERGKRWPTEDIWVACTGMPNEKGGSQ